MIPFKIWPRIVCLMAVSSISVTWGQEENACILFTKGGPEEMLAMMLMAESLTFLETCQNDFHIGLVQTLMWKKNLVRRMFQSLNTNVTIYDGESFETDDADVPFEKVRTIASDTIADVIKQSNKQFHILVLGSSIDLGGWDSASHASSMSNGEIDSMKLIFGHVRLQHKIQISSETLNPLGSVFSITTFPELFIALKSVKEVAHRIQRMMEFRASAIVATMAMFDESLIAHCRWTTFRLSKHFYPTPDPHFELEYTQISQSEHYPGHPVNAHDQHADLENYTHKFVTKFNDPTLEGARTPFKNVVVVLIKEYTEVKKRSKRNTKHKTRKPISLMKHALAESKHRIPETHHENRSHAYSIHITPLCCSAQHDLPFLGLGYINRCNLGLYYSYCIRVFQQHGIEKAKLKMSSEPILKYIHPLTAQSFIAALLVMSPNTAEANDILNEDKYFVWEFNARKKLAKKGLLIHIDAMKASSEGDANASTWKVNDMKAFATICTMINPSLQSMVRTAQTTAVAWEFLKTFIIIRSIHNRVQIRRKLHEFKMMKKKSIMNHFLKLDGLCMSMQAVGDEVSHDEQLVISKADINLFQAKEMLSRKYEGIDWKKKNALASKATRNYMSKGPRSKETRNKFAGTCFICNKYGHKEQHCWKNPDRKMNIEQAFTVGEYGTEGWLLDSGGSSHVCPFQDEFMEVRSLNKPVGISIANGETVLAAGVGTIRIISANKKPIRIEDVLYVPELDRQLLSNPALSTKGLQVTFRNKTCDIRNDHQELITKVTQTGKFLVLECDILESTRASEEMGSRAKSMSPDIWHARLRHLTMKSMKPLEKCVGGFKTTKILFAGGWDTPAHTTVMDPGEIDSMELIFGCVELQHKIHLSSESLNPHGNDFSKTIFPKLYEALHSARRVATVKAFRLHQRKEISRRIGDNGLEFRASAIVATMALLCEDLIAESKWETFSLSRSGYRPDKAWKMYFSVSSESENYPRQPANSLSEMDNDHHQYTLKVVTKFKDPPSDTHPKGGLQGLANPRYLRKNAEIRGHGNFNL
uniref:Putative polyprotein n=1 Tax=Albugo laibachii Nc14 TaxID=890382 RepID=F0WRW0_9STRA|nr:putative polyprotein [Albugo laibachii Nc14]|eukprot:CCA24076.1 putative polyprotein [Albugo laibachii Nc14]